jgi:hypothetical protein
MKSKIQIENTALSGCMPSILESNFRTLQKRDRFESDKLDEALELYLNAIPKVQKVVDVGDPIIGDINVKISRILQGSAVIEAAIDYMEKAKQIFTAAHKTEKVKEKKLVLGEKIVDAIMGISNLHVNLGEIDKAKIAFEVRACSM